MSRYRLRPSPAQEAMLLGHCAHARYVWNLCVEQESHWHIAAGSRESQALFRCVACGYACNADVNAAKNIAAGHAVTARGGFRDAGPASREPQPMLLLA